jgi:hypothetical protein
VIHAELAARYLQLLRSVLTQRDPDGRLRAALAPAAEKIVRWVSRAIELAEDQPAPFILGAQAAFDLGDDAAFVEYVNAAVTKGLAVEDARSLCERALQLRPDAEAVVALLKSLGGEAAEEDAAARPPEAGP